MKEPNWNRPRTCESDVPTRVLPHPSTKNPTAHDQTNPEEEDEEEVAASIRKTEIDSGAFESIRPEETAPTEISQLYHHHLETNADPYMFER